MNPSPHGTDLLNEILLGLRGENKSLPSKLLYDATGSELFQRITELPEYYLTRTERKLLADRATDIVAAMPAEAGHGRALVEFGAGNESKAVTLLDVADSRFRAYVAIDISPSVLEPLRARMRISHPRIQVETLPADFLQPLAMPAALGDMHRVGFLPGSTIGQLPPAAVVQFMAKVRRALTQRHPPAFVIGTDLCRDVRRLLPAYDDSAGVSKAFHLNVLTHVNRLTGSDLNPKNFGRKVRWNPQEERVEMYLESLTAQTVRIAGRSIDFAEHETIETGVSYKYSKERFLAIAAEAGWISIGFWEDAEKLFGIHLLRAG
jgi:L-histidine Nalpha-methyltransferase